MNDIQMTSIEPESEHEHPQPLVDPDRKPKSGYARSKLKLNRAYQMIATLQDELAELQADHAALEGTIEIAAREAFSRLAQAPQRPWFEDANQILAQLAEAPDQRSLQVMTAALAGLQQRLAQIVMRVTA